MLPQIHEIAAFLPRYTDTGDTTAIITADGQTHILPLRLKSVLHRLAARQAIDLAALRRNVGRATGRTIHQPLPFSSQTLFVPVKIRTPKIDGDPSTGYLNYYMVKDIQKLKTDPRYTTVALNGGTAVNTLWSVKTLQNCIKNAKLAAHEAAPALCQPEMRRLERKLVEIIYEILANKRSS